MFQLENEKGRAPGRAFSAKMGKRGHILAKTKFEIVKKSQLCCHGIYKGCLLKHKLVVRPKKKICEFTVTC